MLIDLVVLLLHYLPGIVLALPVLIWGFRALRTEGDWRRAMACLALVVAIAAAVCLVAALGEAPRHAWSAARLAPGIAWIRGYQLYYPPQEGPVLVQMYGPVSGLLYAPAALAARPTTAILIGAAIDLLIYFLPAAWFLASSARQHNIAQTIAGFAAFALISSRQMILSEAATRVTIDAPAIGFATCAFAVMASERLRGAWQAGLLCGVFVALSIWSKLTLAPIFLALALYSMLTRAPREALKFIAGMSMTLAAVTGIFVLWFGPEMLFQNIVIPIHQPWKWPWMGSGRAFLRVFPLIWRDSQPVGWVAVVALATWLLVCRRWRSGDLREWARRNPWLLPLFGAVFVLPTAALAYVKIGGAFNNSVASTFFILLAVIGALRSLGGSVTDRLASVPPRTRLARLALAALLLGCLWIEKDTIRWIRAGMAAWSNLSDNEHEQAYRYALEHPGEAYFPNYPLSTLLAEGKLYHFCAGIDSAAWGGYPVSESHLRAWLPAKLRIVFFSVNYRPDMLRRLPEYDQQGEIPSMPGWYGLTRAGEKP